MKPKPIFMLGVSCAMSNEETEATKEALQKQMNDYHVVVYNRTDRETSYEVIWHPMGKGEKREKVLPIVDKNKIEK